MTLEKYSTIAVDVRTHQGSREGSSVVAALLERQLKCSDLPGRREKGKRNARKGKKEAEGKERTERKQKGGKLGKNNKMC